MIPASYLFKDIYRQHWDTPDAPVTARNRRFTTGLLSPLTGIVATLARRATSASTPMTDPLCGSGRRVAQMPTPAVRRSATPCTRQPWPGSSTNS